MNEKLFTTEKFKKGDSIWFCNIEFYPSGRIKFDIKPVKVNICNVFPDSIELDLQGYRYYRVPKVYFLSEFTYSCNTIEKFISDTKEESEKKYNELLKSIIENKYEKFRYFEQSILRRFI